MNAQPMKRWTSPQIVAISDSRFKHSPLPETQMLCSSTMIFLFVCQTMQLNVLRKPQTNVPLQLPTTDVEGISPTRIWRLDPVSKQLHQHKLSFLKVLNSMLLDVVMVSSTIVSHRNVLHATLSRLVEFV